MTYLAVSNLVAFGFLALIPAYALKVFDSPTTGTTLLVSAQGLGAVTMALTLGWFTSRFGRRVTLVAPLMATSVVLAAYASAPTLAWAVAVIFVLGLTSSACFPTTMTIGQLQAPSDVRGRVMAIGLVVIGTFLPVGSLVQGWLADRVGLRATMVGAAVVLAAVLVGIRVLHPGFDAAVADVTGAEHGDENDGAHAPEPIGRAGVELTTTS
jgi:MFS family permease